MMQLYYIKAFLNKYRELEKRVLAFIYVRSQSKKAHTMFYKHTLVFINSNKKKMRTERSRFKVG